MFTPVRIVFFHTNEFFLGLKNGCFLGDSRFFKVIHVQE